jgi:hypothetical protein
MRRWHLGGLVSFRLSSDDLRRDSRHPRAHSINRLSRITLGCSRFKTEPFPHMAWIKTATVIILHFRSRKQLPQIETSDIFGLPQVR